MSGPHHTMKGVGNRWEKRLETLNLVHGRTPSQQFLIQTVSKWIPLCQFSLSFPLFLCDNFYHTCLCPWLQTYSIRWNLGDRISPQTPFMSEKWGHLKKIACKSRSFYVVRFIFVFAKEWGMFIDLPFNFFFKSRSNPSKDLWRVSISVYSFNTSWN